MKIKYWGVRGSIASPGVGEAGFYTHKYGGNTSCVEVAMPEYEIILDAGTGIRWLGNDLLKRGFAPGEDKKGHGKAYIFLSHTHGDHVDGFPFFKPAYIPGNEIHIYAQKKDTAEMRRQLSTTWQAMKHRMQSPYFPVELEDLTSSLTFVDLLPDETVSLDGVAIHTAEINHPDGCLGYRIERGGNVITYCTDNQPTAVGKKPNFRDNVVRLAQESDVLIHDGQYTPADYERGKQTWGHSTYEHAIQNAVAANARALVLFHHEPEYDDKALDDLGSRASDYLASYIRENKRDLDSIGLYLAREGIEQEL